MSDTTTLKRTPLYDVHRELLARLVPFAGWEMPVQYPSGILAEHKAVREHAGIFDVSHMGEFEVTGPDRNGFVNRVTSNDVGALETGHVQYSTLLNDQGTELAVRAAHGLEEEVKLDMRIPFGRGIAGSIAARNSTMVIEDMSQAEVVSPILRAKGLHTLLGTPLVLDGRGIGVVHVGSLSPRRFTPEDARLLELVADRIATAIGRARLFEAEQRARHDA